MELTFDAALWRYQGDAPWYFVSVPVDLGEVLRETAPPRRGFGSIRVRVCAGDQQWETSVFPDARTRSYVLPVKRSVRDALGVDDGDRLSVVLTPLHVAPPQAHSR